MGNLKVVVVTNIPAHYRVPVFNALARMPGVDLEVLYCSLSEHARSWDVPRNMEYTWRVVDARPLRLRTRPLYASPKILNLVASARPDVLLTGGFSVHRVFAFAYKHLSKSRVGLVLFGEATRTLRARSEFFASLP